MHNIPDDCAKNPLAPWNEKRAHPGSVFALAEKNSLDALDHIAAHAKLWIDVSVVALAMRELAVGCIECQSAAEELDRLLRDCSPVGISWIGGASWLCEVALEAIGKSITDDMGDRDLARLLTACAQAGNGKLSAVFPRDEFDSWQDMCQRDWEANA